MSDARGLSLALSSRQYTWLDRATKLGGVVLIAAGLDVGGDTLAGLVLAALGVALGLSTVIIHE